MQRNGIVDARRDARLFEARLQPFTIVSLYYVEMINRKHFFHFGGRLHGSNLRQQVVVKRGVSAARRGPLVEVWQLRRKNGRLQAVQPTVKTGSVMFVLAGTPMVAKLGNFFGDVSVIRDDR